MATKKTNNPKRVLVTGGLGFIGHKIVQLLEKQKYKVEIADVLTTYGLLDKEELEYLYGERLKTINKNTKVHKVDVAELDETNTVFATFKPDYVIHLASLPNQNLVGQNPVEAAHTMCQGTSNVLDNCVRHKVQKVLYISSSMVLGSFNDETSPDGVNELHKADPMGAYAIWKFAGEKIVEDFNRVHGLDYTIVRPSAVYGPMDNAERVIGRFMISAMRDRTLTVNGETECLDFTYVDDVAQGIIDALVKGKKGIYHLTRGKSVTIKQAADTIVKIVGKGKVKVGAKNKDMPSRGALNCSKAKKDFKYNPKIDIDKGLEMYYNWIKQAEFYKAK